MPHADKEARKAYVAEWNKKNAERIKAKSAIYRAENKEKIRKKDNEYKAANREKINAQALEYRTKNKDAIRKRDKTWRDANREQILQRWKERYKADPEKYLNHNRRWRLGNAEYFKALRKERYQTCKDAIQKHHRIRWDQQKAVGEPANPSRLLRRYVYEKFSNQCFKCGNSTRLSIDHHNPLISGNRLTEHNAVLLCVPCNVRKRSKHPSDFYTETELHKLHEWYGIITLEKNNIMRVPISQ